MTFDRLRRWLLSWLLMSPELTLPKKMSLTEAEAFIGAHPWKAASSPKYKDWPHEYLHRDKAVNQDDYEAFVRFIRENGFKKKWFKATYTYCKVSEHYYWTMGAPVAKTIIINRATRL